MTQKKKRNKKYNPRKGLRSVGKYMYGKLTTITDKERDMMSLHCLEAIKRYEESCNDLRYFQVINMMLYGSVEIVDRYEDSEQLRSEIKQATRYFEKHKAMVLHALQTLKNGESKRIYFDDKERLFVIEVLYKIELMFRQLKPIDIYKINKQAFAFAREHGFMPRAMSI